MFVVAKDYYPETRILEVHQGTTGWYFTVHKDDLLIYKSPEGEDRVKVTLKGMKYFDNLCRIAYEARIQQKGLASG